MRFAAAVKKFSVPVLLLQVSFGTYGFAAEGWVCTETLGPDKERFDSDYVIIGETFVMNKGRGHAKILLNDEQTVIAYIAFWNSGFRLRWTEKDGNKTAVAVTGPHDNPELITQYLILNKSQNTLTTLDNIRQSVNAPLVQDLDPAAKKVPCRRADQ
jgi:hypothetical protein